MNERIKELALEVFSFKYKTDPNELNPGHNMDHIYKFAELIIQGCISQIAIIGISNDENEDILWTVDLAILNIKDRFGMK